MLLNSLISEIRCGVEAVASQQLEWRDAIPLQARGPVSGPAAVSR